MTKKILLTLSIFCFIGATVFGQAIEGGAGIIHVDGNPNLMLTMDDLSVNEGHVAYDRTAGIAYFFDPAGTNFATSTPAVGTQWIAVNITNLLNPITSILTPENELSVSIAAGVATITFESNATISYAPGTNTLTFSDVDGDDTDIDLSELDDIVQAETGNASITVTGDGSSGTPYEVSLTGADAATSGTVPVTDGAGTLTWTDVVTGAVIDGTTGELELTMTGGTNVKVDLSTLPEVANMGDVTTQLGLLASGESALLKAANLNTFGMPATTGFGVIFVIEKP